MRQIISILILLLAMPALAQDPQHARSAAFESARLRVETPEYLEAKRRGDEYSDSHRLFQIAGTNVSLADLAGGWWIERLPILTVVAACAAVGAVLGLIGKRSALGAILFSAATFAFFAAGQTAYDLASYGARTLTIRIGMAIVGLAAATTGFLAIRSATKSILLIAGINSPVLKPNINFAAAIKPCGIVFITLVVNAVIKEIVLSTLTGPAYGPPIKNLFLSIVQALDMMPPVFIALCLTGIAVHEMKKKQFSNNGTT